MKKLTVGKSRKKSDTFTESMCGQEYPTIQERARMHRPLSHVEPKQIADEIRGVIKEKKFTAQGEIAVRCKFRPDGFLLSADTSSLFVKSHLDFYESTGGCYSPIMTECALINEQALSERMNKVCALLGSNYYYVDEHPYYEYIVESCQVFKKDESSEHPMFKEIYSDYQDWYQHVQDDYIDRYQIKTDRHWLQENGRLRMPTRDYRPYEKMMTLYTHIACRKKDFVSQKQYEKCKELWRELRDHLSQTLDESYIVENEVRASMQRALQWCDTSPTTADYIFSGNIRVNPTQRSIRIANTCVVDRSLDVAVDSFAIPNIMQMNSSYVVLDPGGRIYAETGDALSRFGYRVKTINLKDFNDDTHYNPLCYCKSDSDISELAATILQTSDPGQEENLYWYDGATDLLSAVLALVVYFADNPDIMGEYVSSKTLNTVSKILHLTSDPDGHLHYPVAESVLGQIFKRLEQNIYLYQKQSYALTKWQDFITQYNPKTLEAIITRTAIALERFTIPEVASLLSSDTINLEDFGNHYDALFLILPTHTTHSSAIAGLCLQQLLSILYQRPQHASKYFYWVITMQDGTIVDCYYQNSEKEVQCELYQMQQTAQIELHTNQGTDSYEVFYQDAESNRRTLTCRPTEELAKQYVEALKDAECIHKSASNPIRVRLILNDLTSVFKHLPVAFADMMGTMSKFNISCELIVQSINALRTQFPYEWETMLSNCSFALLFQPDDANISLLEESIKIPDMLPNIWLEDECMLAVNNGKFAVDKIYRKTTHPYAKYLRSATDN